MKSKIFLTIGLFLICKIGICQRSDSHWNNDQVSKATVLLYQNYDKYTKFGTGTIINHKNRFYLITATHVANELKKDSKIVIETKGKTPITLDLRNLIKDMNLKWTDHPEADVSIIQLFPFSSEIEQRLKKCSFPSLLINKEKINLPKEQNVIYFGFTPKNLEMNQYSLLSFYANLSSGLIKGIRSDNNKGCSFFFLDKPSMEGCSGGSVFGLSAKSIKLIGIVHGTASDNTGGKLAIITPSYYIWELLKGFEQSLPVKQ